ncbi:type II secretion system F family protein [Rhodopirellula sp. MGV]|uniref:type II secretion system F family protein n=1 Tax=Rhodopirellula sp. MGV TaxID=2023130 RepID=UPI000B9657B3|nr:type II secretion system F family protein [Rhodopirellula sp. MGV]OYP34908.1 hypothetical protein CGZ80_12810 [Rhodopirellula sp. MGV]PNY38195.1 type II secretion protein F [Rhodopirellula baltica]
MNADPGTLDDESFAMLLDEVCAMASSGRSLPLGLRDLEDKSLARLGRAARKVRTDLEKGSSLSNSISAFSKTYQIPVRIAIETMSRTGSIEPVRETVRTIRAANEDRRQLRLGAINPTINAIAAVAIAFVVTPFTILSLAESELIKSPFAPTERQLFNTFSTNFLTTAAVTAVILVALIVLLFGLFRWLNRSRVSSRQLASFARWLAIQVSPGIMSHRHTQDTLSTGSVDLAKAIDAASSVNGEAFARQWSSVSAAIRSGANGEPALAFPDSAPDPIRQCVADLASGQRSGPAVAFDLKRLGDLYQQQARRYRNWWVNGILRVTSIGVMLWITFFLLKHSIGPLLELLDEVMQ